MSGHPNGEFRLLAIETSGGALSIALRNGVKVVSRHIHAPRQQLKLAVPTIAEVLEEAALSVGDLDAIAFGRGPGSFTGIRVATCLAQGLGLGAAIPLLPISSMACLAQGVVGRQEIPQVLVCLDARLGEVYWGLFCELDGLVVLQDIERIGLPADVEQPQQAFALVGSAMNLVDANLARLRGAAHYHDSAVDPDATDLLPLAARAWAHHEAVTADKATPVYLRNQVANRETLTKL